MKERFDPRTQDIFLYLTRDELTEFLGLTGLGGVKLVNDEKKVSFILFRDVANPKQDSKIIDVEVAYDIPGKEGLGYTNFVINISRRGCNQLKTQGLCEDRYTGLTGSEKVHILVEEEI